MRVIDVFDKGADQFPDRDFLVDGATRRKYRESQALTHRIAAALHAAGFQAHTKISVYSPNCATAFECVLSVFRAGAVSVPLNARNGAAENALMLNGMGVKVVFFHASLNSEVEYLKAHCPGVELFVCINAVSPNGACLDEWLDIVPNGARIEVQTQPGDPVAIPATGGTTGTPKGAVWTSRQFETQVASFYRAMPPSKTPVHLVTAPLTHAAGFMTLILSAAGATHVLSSADPLAILQAIQRERVTYLLLPPTLIYVVLAHPRLREFSFDSVEYLMYGGAPMAKEKLKEAIAAFGPVLAQTYGQMEAPGFCTFLSRADHVESLNGDGRRLLSCGRAVLLTEVAVMDDNGNLLADDVVGELVVRGDLVMEGYYQNPEATAEVSKFGWHHTGDLGYRDSDGYFFIVDRKRDMIISGSFNVYPGEVEQVLWTHAAVQDCAVIGVPDEKWGEAVKAVVQLKPGAEASEADLIALCKAHLGSVKAPKSVEFWDVLPRTSVGKVSKKDIRERFWSGQERRI